MCATTIAVRELKPGDQILDAGAFSGYYIAIRTAEEMNRDLTTWIAVRAQGGTIHSFDTWDSPVRITGENTWHTREFVDSDAADGFVAPKALAELIAAALTHRRAFSVVHGAANSGHPFVTFTARWHPPGCEVLTELILTWHTYETGTYRLFSALGGGYRTRMHDITAKKAMQHITGVLCFSRPFPHTVNGEAT